MKRLFTMLLTFVLAFTLAMPVFAQETTGQEAAPKEKKVEKKKKVPKEKKKKVPKEKEATPPAPPK